MCLPKTGLKIFLIILNIILFMCAAVLLGIGIWALADKVQLSDIFGDSLFNSAAILLVICGSFLLILSCFGCFASIVAKRIVLIGYLSVLGVIFILMLSAASAAAAFEDKIDDSIKRQMSFNLENKYGYNLEFEENARITNSWNQVQTKFQCCGVENKGFIKYQQTQWFVEQNRMLSAGSNPKELVPRSCCVYEETLRQYKNVLNCQTFAYGPPRYIDGAHNDALYYKGCYDAAKDFIKENSKIILGIGFGFCVFLITAFVIGIMYLRSLSAGESANFKQDDRQDTPQYYDDED